ncbi:hypothetical protein, partial [Thiorhodococcus mannitoliphagus]|uniref:hypothetical protein n=1 Tax=Thiorhodococcus mannitoliphagus TaxID=329406 RepID=UPI00197F1FAE
GNSSDKTAFRETVSTYMEQLQGAVGLEVRAIASQFSNIRALGSRRFCRGFRCLEDQFVEIALVPAGLQAFAMEAALEVIVRQTNQCDAPDQCQILTG